MNELQRDEIMIRLEMLEEENRRQRVSLRRMTALLGALLAVVFCAGAAFQNIGRFQKAVEVFDANNVPRAVMFADDNTGRSGLEIRKPRGEPAFEARTNRNHDPLLLFRDANGQVRIEMGIAENGQAYLAIRNGAGGLVHDINAPL